jgi:hypothetical protein
MAAGNHIINKQIIEIQMPGDYEHGRQVQDQVTGLFSSKVIPVMEALFDSVTDDDTTLRLDKLVIDLGKLPVKFDRRFAKLVERKLHAELQEILVGNRLKKQLQELGIAGSRDERNARFISAEESELEILAFYLRSGRLPWNAGGDFRGKPFNVWFRRLREKFPEGVIRILNSELRSGRQRIRFVYQLNNSDLSETLVFIAASGLGMQALKDLEFILLLTEQLSETILKMNRSGTVTGHKQRAAVWSSVIERVTTQEAASVKELMNRDWIENLVLSAVPGLKSQEKQQIDELIDSLIKLANIPRTKAEAGIRKVLRTVIDTRPVAKKDRSPGTYQKRGTKDGLKQHPAIPDQELKEVEESLKSEIINRGEKSPETKREDADQEFDYSRNRDYSKPLSPVLIRNAGLILLHPFLIPLFKERGLLEGKSFKSDEAQQRAVFLLHYLATGKTECPEDDLILNKILCGLEADHPLVPGVELTGNDKTACNDLLESVISHWKALKRTSPPALQQTFLQREGSLSWQSTGRSWKLVIERKTPDILLNRLPWGLSIVKLPWCKNLIYVQW